MHDHIVNGYTVNQKRLLEQTEKLRELQKAIDFIKDNFTNELDCLIDRLYRNCGIQS